MIGEYQRQVTALTGKTDMKPRYAHQQKFFEKNPNYALLLWETGLGKTRSACEWIHEREEKKALVICPKAIVEKWKRELIEWGAYADVVSRDNVKKVDISDYRALVIDEAQDFAAPLFIAGRSQRATTIYTHIQKYPETHVLLLSATPIRSTSWNYHTLATYIGGYIDWKKFQKKFFYLTDTFGRWHYEPVKTWRKDIRPYLEGIADIVLARDCADIPPQRHHVVDIEWDKTQEKALKDQYLEPAAEWHARHRAENSKKKYETLSKMLDGYRKAIVIVYYRAQIDEYVKEIGGDRQVFVLHGNTEDQDAVIAAAREADDCIFFLQASMGAGFDASEFSVMIFASMSFKFVDHVQALGRINRLNNLHPNDYFYLIGGKNDRSVYETVMAGHDFHPPSYMAKKG